MRKGLFIAFALVVALAGAGCGGDDSDDGGGANDAFLKDYDAAYGPMTAKQPDLSKALQSAPTADAEEIAASLEPVAPAAKQTSEALAALKPPADLTDELKTVQDTVDAVVEEVDAAIAAGKAGETAEARTSVEELGKAVQPFIEANAALRKAAGG